MKKQILTLIIGILIGAIITTGVFLVLKGNDNNMERMNMGEQPSFNGNEMGGFPGGDRGNMRDDTNTDNTVQEDI